MKSHLSRVVGQLLFLLPLIASVPFIIKLLILDRRELESVHEDIIKFAQKSELDQFSVQSTDLLCRSKFENDTDRCNRIESGVIALDRRMFRPFLSMNFNVIVHAPVGTQIIKIEGIQGQMMNELIREVADFDGLMLVDISFQTRFSEAAHFADNCGTKSTKALDFLIKKEMVLSSSSIYGPNHSLIVQIRLVLSNKSCPTKSSTVVQIPDWGIIIIVAMHDSSSLPTYMLSSFLGLTDFRGDGKIILHRFMTKTLLHQSASNLISFHRIISENPDLSLPFEVSDQFSASQAKLTSCIEALKQTSIDAMDPLKCSKDSYKDAFSVLYHDKVTSLDTFPLEHFFALLAPFWFPLVAPVIFGTIRELKGLMGRGEKEAEEDEGYESDLGEQIL